MTNPSGDFKNPGNLLYNNLPENVLRQEVKEYSVMIDSKDRNYQVYPDPFHYEVNFCPQLRQIEYVDGRQIIHEDAMPIINSHFKNVQYIKLESAILPFYTRTKWAFDEDNEKVLHVDTDHALTDELYLVLNLGDGYRDTNYFSTNDVLADSFATVYYDKKINNTHYATITKNGIKSFPLNNLGEIRKLRINFTDPYGVPLKCPHLNPEIKSDMRCPCHDPDVEDWEREACFRHNLSHPLHPFFQHHLVFKVGVVEARLDRKVFT